jgi:cell division protease FtsH
MIACRGNSRELFLGHSAMQTKNVSEATAREIDAEIKEMISRAYAKAKRLLTGKIEEIASTGARPAGV